MFSLESFFLMQQTWRTGLVSGHFERFPLLLGGRVDRRYAAVFIETCLVRWAGCTGAFGLRLDWGTRVGVSEEQGSFRNKGMNHKSDLLLYMLPTSSAEPVKSANNVYCSSTSLWLNFAIAV